MEPESEQRLQPREGQDHAGSDREHRQRGAGTDDQADAADEQKRAPDGVLRGRHRRACEPRPGRPRRLRQPGATDKRLRGRGEDDADGAEPERELAQPAGKGVEQPGRRLLREQRGGRDPHDRASRRDQEQQHEAGQRDVD